MDTLSTKLPNKNNLPEILFLGSQMATGGSQKMLLTMARWFFEKGYPVSVAFFHDREGLLTEWQSGYPIQIYNLHAWRKSGGWRNVFRLAAGSWRLLRLFRHNNTKVVMTFTHHANLLGISLAWAAQIPVRVAGHRGVIDGFPYWMERLHTLMVNHGMATLLVVVSELLKLHAIEVEGILPERMLVIENGITLPRKEPVSPEQQALRSEFGLNANDFFIFSVGRLNRQKGQAFLLEAFAKVLVKFPHSFLAIAGEGSLRQDLENQARKLGIEQRVRFLGVRSDIPSLLGLADLFVLPSLWEGMPVALIEAMGVGLPIIATQVEGVDELVKDGESGLIVPPANPEALKQAIEHLISDPQLRHELGQMAEATIQDRFTVDRMCENYEKLFLELLSKVRKLDQG